MTTTTERADEKYKCNKRTSLVLSVGEIALKMMHSLQMITGKACQSFGVENNFKSFQVGVNRSLCTETLQG